MVVSLTFHGATRSVLPRRVAEHSVARASPAEGTVLRWGGPCTCCPSLLSPNGKACFIWDLQRKRYSPNGCVRPEGGKNWGTQSQQDVITIPGRRILASTQPFLGRGCPNQAQMPSVRWGAVRLTDGPRAAHHLPLPLTHRCPRRLGGTAAVRGLCHRPGDQVCLSGLGHPGGHHHPRA